MLYLSVNERLVDAFIRGILPFVLIAIFISLLHFTIYLFRKIRSTQKVISFNQFVVEQIKILYGKAKSHLKTTIAIFSTILLFITLFFIAYNNDTIKAHRIIKKELSHCEIIHFGPLVEVEADPFEHYGNYCTHKKMICFFCDDNGYASTTFIFDDDFCIVKRRNQSLEEDITSLEESLEGEINDLDDRLDWLESELESTNETVSDLEDRIYW